MTESVAFERLKGRWPGLRKNGIRDAIRKFRGGPEFLDDWTCLGKPVGWIPDATLLDPAAGVIHAFEIEFRAVVDEQRLKWIQRFCMSFYDWTEGHIELWLVDRHGFHETNIWGTKDSTWREYTRTGEWMTDREIERREKEYASQTTDTGNVEAGPGGTCPGV